MSVRFYLFSLPICFNISALQHPQDVFVKKRKMKADLQCSRQQKPKLESLNIKEPVDQSKDLRFIVSMNESDFLRKKIQYAGHRSCTQ